MSERKKLVVIDGKSVFYRGYYAMPNLSLPDGTPTGGVYGFAVMALEVIKKMEPDYVVVAWDKPKTNIRARLKIYPQYKAGRKPMPDDMREQIPYLHKLLEAFGWPLYECDDYEADDIMATLSAQADKKDIDSILITSDQDMLQHVNGHTTIALLKKGLTNIDMVDGKKFARDWKMTTEQYVDYKAMRGDPSDNIPGIPGVGEKTAKTLIEKYKSLDGLYEHTDELKGALQKKVIDNKDMAYMSRELVKIIEDAPVKIDLKTSAIDNVDPVAVQKILNEYQFKTLLHQIPKNWHKVELALEELEKADTKAIKVVEGLSGLSRGKELVVQMYENKLWISGSSKQVNILGSSQLDQVSDWLVDESIPKIGYDIKETIKSLLSHDIELKNIGHDVRIGAFLINSLIREQSLGSLMGGELDESNPAQVVSSIWELYEDQTKQMKGLGRVPKLAQEIEWPVIEVLARMEFAGIKLDTKYLAKMSRELEDQISDIEQKIYGHADTEFNIASPSQLAEVLFEKLKIPTTAKQALEEGLIKEIVGNWFIKKGKTGYSTAANELKKISELHPIVPLIGEFREYTKLKNTYVDTLPEQVDSESKLHTNFALDVAPTGRLSSHDPNLQNIPIRSELGKKIRNAFVPEKGNVFVSADYSQFELRLAAHLSGEKDMIKAFNEGVDVHQLTAAQIADKPVEEVTKQERYNAKAINFGIMYGQGPFALAEQQAITQKEAKAFIERYFEVRPNLRKYIDNLREQAKKDGYVETIFGRRRPTPDVNSSNFMVREGAYRAAVNTPLQGSAADLMKLAMIEIDKVLPAGAKQLIQIHDSILVECPANEAEKVSELLKTTMENVHKLPVKLDVDVTIGKNWGEV